MANKPSKKASEGISQDIDSPIEQVVSMRLVTLITLVTIFVSIASYFYSTASTEDLIQEQLLKYISERGLRESALFLESEAYQARFQKEYVERYKRMGDKDPIEWFEGHMEKRAEDGTYRSKPELYYGKDRELGRRDVSASMMIGAKTKVTPEVRRALAIGYDMINQYGPAWRKPFVDLYFSSPEKTSVSRWPGTPWGLMMDDKVEWREEEWMAITMKEKNPQREQKWSGVLYDERNGNWMVSNVTPLDIDGKQVGMVGTDLLLDDLVKRTVNETLSGTYNILLQADGRVIAHPDKIEEVIANKGILLAQTSADENLLRIYEFARTATIFPIVIDNEIGGELLAITHIQGPEWYFITVYPRSLLAARAWRNVGFIFLSGLSSLVVILLVIGLVIKRNIVYPLGRLTQAVRNFKIPLGQWSNQADKLVEKASALSIRPDEIGLLARAFVDMGGRLGSTYDELEASEEKYRTLFERDSSAIFIYDPDTTNILDANKATLIMYGYDKDELIGMSCLNLRAEGEDSASSTNRISEDNEVTVIYSLHRRKDGTVFPVNINGYGITVGGKNVMCAVSNDITEQKQLQAQLLQAQKMEAIGHLAGGVAHDFNNILAAIVGYAHISLMRAKDNDPLRMNLEQIIASTERGANLTKSLLSFSRKQAIHMKSVNINNVVMGMTTMLGRIIGEDMYLQLNTTDHDLIINADANQLEQVLMNLATNARDAMPGVGTLTITTEEIEIDEKYVRVHQGCEAGKYAVLSVTDTGIGMDETIKDNIFDPFFTTKEVGKGTGLGLAMIYGTIKQHEGFIDVYSVPGEGTTFKIYLRLLESGVDVCEMEEITAIPSGNETILLVEDDDAVRNATKELLKEFGYTVIEAIDGKHAVELFIENKGNIQLVITDIIMPGQSGKELHNELLKIASGTKVIFVSGYSADTLAQKGIIDSEVVFILKPFQPATLFNKIREVLDE